MTRAAATLLLIAVCSLPAHALDVVGVLGLSEVETDAAVAVWFPLPQDRAVTAVRWYNNDGTTVFPELLLSAGLPGTPGLLSAATVVRLDAQGGSDRWARVELEEPVASAVDGLYVLFRLPPGSVPVSRGEGGGAAVGYGAEAGGPTAWLTPDGEHWIRLSEGLALGVEVETEAAAPGTVRLERDTAKHLALARPDAGTPAPVDAFLKPSPNPFNPKTALRFSLREAGPVLLEVYDLMGRKLAVPAQGRFSAGPHEVEWTARDAKGREMASGVYLARLKLRGFESTQRLVLVR